MAVLHMELRGDVHMGCCLHMERLAVGVLLLDSPIVMDILQPLTLQTRGESLYITCVFHMHVITNIIFLFTCTVG